MTETRAFLYVVNNLTGCAIGVSDYGFSCAVMASTEEAARDWGITVAIEYAAKFGFPPHDLKPTDDEVIRNSVVMDCPNPESAEHICSVGEFPVVLR